MTADFERLEARRFQRRYPVLQQEQAQKTTFTSPQKNHRNHIFISLHRANEQSKDGDPRD